MIEVIEVSPKSWKEMAENAHKSVFDESWDKELERVDLALLMINKEVDDVISYVTIQIKAKGLVYLQYGGTFKKYRGSIMSFKSFSAMLEHLKSRFTQIVTLVENTNYPMLKFYMKENFKITGIRYFKDSILLENHYEH